MPKTDMSKEKKKNLLCRVLFTFALILTLLFAAQSVMLPETVSAQAASSSYTGWKTKSGNKYYYKNGKKVTGWKKISGKYYYFNSKGKLQTNKIVGSKKKGYYYVDSSGVRVTDKTIKRRFPVARNIPNLRRPGSRGVVPVMMPCVRNVTTITSPHGPAPFLPHRNFRAMRDMSATTTRETATGLPPR